MAPEGGIFGQIRRIGWLRFALSGLFLLAGLSWASADERINLRVEAAPEGYGRLLIEFADRLDLPEYTIRSENNVLAISFDEPLDVVLPDISGILHEFVAVARIDPDRRGLRFGLKPDVTLNRIEAAERLFIDFMPPDWRGLPPSLPNNVVAELADRAEQAAILAEQERKARLAELIRPEATLTVGRHSTFTRLSFDWTIETDAEFQTMSNGRNVLAFEWPVDISVYSLRTSLPEEITDVSTMFDADGSRVEFTTVEGVKPRFYEMSPSQYVVDIDRLDAVPTGIDAAELLAAEGVSTDGVAEENMAEDAITSAEGTVVQSSQTKAMPFASLVGSTVRLVFPFEDETPAAVFRRGDAIWMVFDTSVVIDSPDGGGELESISGEFTVISAGDLQIVRMVLTEDRLATLGSEGTSWVLSLGDVLLTPTEPVQLSRRQDGDGLFEMVADIQRPARVHELRDSLVGDVLEIVTAYPPARGIIRDLRYVDFTALQSVHGFVVKPRHSGVSVMLEGDEAVIRAEGGLRVSALDEARGSDSLDEAMLRTAFMDLVSLEERDPVLMHRLHEELMARTAETENLAQAAARLDLAKFLIANRLSYEAVGILRLLQEELETDELDEDLRIARAAALTAIGHTDEALPLLETEAMSDTVDALVWRTIARADSGHFAGAREDAQIALSAIANYPHWVQARFNLAALRSAIEVRDVRMAERLIDTTDTVEMSAVDVGAFQLLVARADELEGRYELALDRYGRLIAQDIRPVRAEATYRTLLLLDGMNRLDPNRAAELLAGVVITWRGNTLESQMLELLSDLYFRAGSYRLGFESAKQAALFHSGGDTVSDVVDRARLEFVELYLNGKADALDPVEALGIYYDFRQLTPSGARGDEMIRNLARRLIRSDLLGQAAELLQYQIDERLEGAARAQIAADLAIVQIANRNPEEALRVLHDSRLENLPPTLERQRRILETRALIDAGRNELAIDLLAEVDGRDADLLRVDAHWQGRRYREAGELLELIYAPENPDQALTHTARMSLVKAAVGYVLADDQIGLSRIRIKFGDLMADSPEWPMFQFVTGEVTSDSVEFRDVAREVANLDTLTDFLDIYRERYASDGALTPNAVAQGSDV